MLPKNKKIIDKKHISLENILNNDIFKNDCKKRIKGIVKENNLNILDVNIILKIVVDVINEYNNIEISKKNTKFMLKTIVIKIFEELNFLDYNNKKMIEELLNSGIELVSSNIKYKGIFTKKYESVLNIFCFYKKSLKSKNNNPKIPNNLKNELTIESILNDSSDDESIRDRINSSEESFYV